MKPLLLILIFFFVGAFLIISNNNLALSEEGNFDKLVKLYGEWLGDVRENLASVTAYVIKMDWLPEK